MRAVPARYNGCMSEPPPSEPGTSPVARVDPHVYESVLRLRMSTHDAHYGGDLVDGARILALFGDVATELLVAFDGDEGLFVAYESVEFTSPVYAGDYVEARGRITRVGNTSRAMTFEATKVVAARPDLGASAADLLAEPLVVCRATGTCVVPAGLHRRG